MRLWIPRYFNVVWIVLKLTSQVTSLLFVFKSAIYVVFDSISSGATRTMSKQSVPHNTYSHVNKFISQ